MTIPFKNYSLIYSAPTASPVQNVSATTDTRNRVFKDDNKAFFIDIPSVVSVLWLMILKAIVNRRRTNAGTNGSVVALADTSAQYISYLITLYYITNIHKSKY